MKRSIRLAILLFVLPLLAAAFWTGQASASVCTWNGGGADNNWNTGANWGGTAPAATGDSLVFDGSTRTTNANDLPVTALVGITYNVGASAFTSTGTQTITITTGGITVNGAATQTLNMPITFSGAQTVSVVSGGKLVLGSAATAYTHSLNNGTIAFTGLGEFSVLTSATGTFQSAVGNTTTMDMSGLATFTANVGTFRVMGTATSTATVRLAGTNTITATTIKIGDTLGGTTLADGILRLGTANTINADTINLGSTRSDGTINFDDGLTNPTVTIKGKAGGAAKADITLGYYQTSPGAYNPTGTANFTGGTVNAQLGTLILGRQAPNGAVTGNSNTAAGTWTMPAGTVTADTVRLGYWSGGNTAGAGTTQLAQGTLNISGGTFTVGTALRLGDGVVGSANTHARGTVNVSGSGALTVSGLFLLGNNGGGGTAANQRGVLNITGGTVTSNVAITTSGGRSTLTLDGGTLDMNGNSIGTLAEQIGSNGGALNFRSGTLQDVSEINGGAIGLTKTTAGTLILDGTNAYTGATDVNAGTLLVNGTYTGGGAYTVASAATLGGTGSIGTSTVNVQAGGILAPGASIESLAVGATTIDGTFLVEVDNAGASDMLNVTGNLALGSASILSVSGTLNVAYTYPIATYTGALTGTFATDNLTGSWYVDYGVKTANTITLVPEPATLALLGLGGLGLLLRRKRR